MKLWYIRFKLYLILALILIGNLSWGWMGMNLTPNHYASKYLQMTIFVLVYIVCNLALSATHCRAMVALRPCGKLGPAKSQRSSNPLTKPLIYQKSKAFKGYSNNWEWWIWGWKYAELFCFDIGHRKNICISLFRDFCFNLFKY